jgi:hypothetical protein
MNKMGRIVPWVVGLLIAGVVLYAVSSGQLMRMLLAMHGKHGG